MARPSPAHLVAMLMGVAGLAMLVSGLAGESRNGVRILLAVLLLATALIASGLQFLVGARSASTGNREGEGT